MVVACDKERLSSFFWLGRASSFIHPFYGGDRVPGGVKLRSGHPCVFYGRGARDALSALLILLWGFPAGVKLWQRADAARHFGVRSRSYRFRGVKTIMPFTALDRHLLRPKAVAPVVPSYATALQECLGECMLKIFVSDGESGA
jgi:hypothetical protein